MVVKDIFTHAGAPPLTIGLGEVILDHEPDEKQLGLIGNALVRSGFEILGDRKRKLVEKIKRFVIKEVRDPDDSDRRNFSDRLASAINMEYSSLSKLFSESENVTIEKYVIDQRIERVKELLVYGEMNLNEIADQLGYSSAAHLSAQFRKVTGFSPTAFRKLKDHHRKPLDGV